MQANSLPVESPGKPKNTGVDSLSLLQRIFPTQESYQGLLNCRQILHPLSCQGSPRQYHAHFIKVCTPNFLCACAQSLQLGLTVCDPVDCSPPGSSIHGILHARTLEWVAMPSSRGSSRPGDRTHVSYVSCTGRWVLYAPWEDDPYYIKIDNLLISSG